jgi:membrane protein implicated in regulation of membrane protease activity
MQFVFYFFLLQLGFSFDTWLLRHALGVNILAVILGSGYVKSREHKEKEKEKRKENLIQKKLYLLL